MIDKGSTWRDRRIPARVVRVLAVFPKVVRYADLKRGAITATTYTSGVARFEKNFSEVSK